MSSMTGFARLDGAEGDWLWTWEAKSVNGRGLELRLRLPNGFDRLDPALRKIAAETLGRGNVSATLSFDPTSTGGGLTVNPDALDAAIRAVRDVMAALTCDNPRPEGVLALRGVIEQEEKSLSEDERAAVDRALSDSFRLTMEQLRENRRSEGASLARVLEDQLDRIDALTRDARASAATAPEAIRTRIAGQLQDLLSNAPVDQDRLVQEAALMAVKADVREELDRLDVHIEAARKLLGETAPVGRRLDFLTQEFNRETNTLCAKAQDIGLKRIGLDLKTVVDQFREQIQNVE